MNDFHEMIKELDALDEVINTLRLRKSQKLHELYSFLEDQEAKGRYEAMYGYIETVNHTLKWIKRDKETSETIRETYKKFIHDNGFRSDLS